MHVITSSEVGFILHDSNEQSKAESKTDNQHNTVILRTGDWTHELPTLNGYLLTLDRNTEELVAQELRGSNVDGTEQGLN